MTRLLQGLDGMKPLKAMAREGSLGPLIEADTEGLNRVQRTIVVSQEAIVEAHEIIRVLAVAGGLYVFVTIWSQPTDSLFVLILLFARILQKVTQLQSQYQVAAANQQAFFFLQSTAEAAEAAREPDMGGATPRFTSRDLASGGQLLLRPRQRPGPCLDGIACRQVHRRRRGLGRRQDDRRRPDHRAASAPARRGMDRRPAHARYRHQGMARHDRIRAAGDVPVPRHDHGQRHAGRFRDIPRPC